jgi:hypothetical protein
MIVKGGKGYEVGENVLVRNGTIVGLAAMGTFYEFEV